MMMRVCNGELRVNGRYIAQFPTHLTKEVVRIASNFVDRLDNPTALEELRCMVMNLVENDSMDEVWAEMMKDPIRFSHFRHLPVSAPPQKPKQVIFSGPKTIVFWPDGDKTIVSLGEGEEFDEYAGFCAAVVKKLFGSTHKAKKFLNSVKAVPKPKAKKKEEQKDEQLDLFLAYDVGEE